MNDFLDTVAEEPLRPSNALTELAGNVVANELFYRDGMLNALRHEWANEVYRHPCLR